MPSIIISLKDGGSDEQLQKVKQSVLDQGGKVTKEYNLIKGFAAEIPDNDGFSALEAHDGVTVEKDQEMRTQ